MDWHTKKHAMNIMHNINVRISQCSIKFSFRFLIDHQFVLFPANQDILKEEQKKKPCAKFPNGNCQFGATCRFSHYTPADLAKIKEKGKVFGKRLYKLINCMREYF